MSKKFLTPIDLGNNKATNVADPTSAQDAATKNYADKLRTVTATVASSNADYITDGVADEVQIQAAIDAVNTAGGGTVLLRAGTYTLATSVILKTGVTLIGEGKGRTIITGPASDVTLVKTTLSGTTKTVYADIAVKDMTIKSKYGTCLAVFNTNNLTVAGCEFTFTVTTPIRQALFIEHCQYVLVDNNYAHDYTGNGLSVTSTDYFVVSNNLVSGGSNGDDGIDIDFDFLDTSAIPSNYGTVVGNTVRTIGRGNGIRVENSNYITVTGNTVDNVTSTASIAAGIMVNTSGTNNGKGITVSGNTVSNCVPGGIAVSGTNLTSVTVTGNVVYNCGQDGGSVRGGIILNAAGVNVTGNTVDTTAKTGTDGGGILIYKKDGHTIANNIIKNCVTGLRAWNGDALQSYTSTLVTDNTFSTNTTNAVTSAMTATSRLFNNYGLSDYGDMAKQNASAVAITGGTITGMPTPTNAQDVAIKSYTDKLRTVARTVGTASADYITDGTADDVEIQAAINEVSAAGGGKVLLRTGTYTTANTITIPSNITIEGESRTKTIVKAAAASNKTVFQNSDTTNGNSYIVIRNLTIDQNGSTQTSGGGSSFTGLTDSVIENVTYEYSFTFNLFVSSLPGTSLTGTITVTNDSDQVTGTGTAFTTELAVDSIIKTAGGRFARVQSITNNTTLKLDRKWGHATETAVTAKVVPANARNRILNCRFKGNSNNDNVGLGLFDDSLIQGCISHNASGYGFGPDHTHRLRFVNNTMYSNLNAGIGAETCAYCVISNNISYGNSNGIYLLSGAYRNVVSNNECRNNSNGIQVQYNSNLFAPSDENQIIGNVCVANTVHGIRTSCSYTVIKGNRCVNNQNSGIVVASDLTDPARTLVMGNICQDTQSTKQQQRGIWVVAGTNTMVVDNISPTADHVSAGLTDTATNTVVINTNGTTNTLGVSQLGAVNKAGDTMTGQLAFSGTTHAGLKLNSLTSTQRDALTAANGMLIYNTTTNTMQKYENGSWADIGAGSSSGISSLNTQTGATQTFANDTNVTITSASNTHTLGWAGTLAVSRGGTGASTATAARQNLGAISQEQAIAYAVIL